MEHTRRTWATVDLAAAKENIIKIRKIVGHSCAMMSVVKADAYGHGAVEIAKTIGDFTDFFAVSNIDEAVQLRVAGIQKPLLILGHTPPHSMSLLAQHDITQTVFSYEYGKKLSQAAQILGKKVNVHIKIDTGMNRLGFSAQNEEAFANSVREIKELSKEPFLGFEGIFTHFAVADEPENPFTKIQFQRFTDCISALEKEGIVFRFRHASNSAAIINFPEMKLNMVRPGLILYGITTNRPDALGLKPVMALKTTVSFIHDFRKGDSVSYGRTFTAPHDMRIATLPIGYADGLFRALSKNLSVIINGQSAPIIGRICMDQCMADVTNLNVNTEDEVTVFGERKSVYDLSDAIDTIPYEIICDIGKRVPRIYKK